MKASTVAARAPAAKRSLERYVCAMQELLLSVGGGEHGVKVGFIRPRTLQGDVATSSQLFPPAESEGDNDDDEDDYGGGEEDEE